MKGKIALVTGATRGIGKAIALELASQGAFVIGTATSESGANEISAFLGEKGAGLVLNVADDASIAEFLNHIKDKFGDVEILVNNAGITRDGLLLRMKDSDWYDVIETNLSSIYKLSKAFLRPMMKTGGRIINIGSVVGSSGSAGQANYAAAKAGLIGFSKALAQEVASRNITVNVIAPGFIATDMTDKLTDTQKESILSQVPMGKMGCPEDIAKAVAFLASDSAKYITGNTLHINGGLYLS